MKTLIIIMLTVVIAAQVIPLQMYGQDSAGAVIINTKVGEVIDASERDYYNLFQTVKNFSSAVIVRLPDGKFIARITAVTSSGQEITSIAIPEGLVFNFAEKIENFEELKAGTYVMGTRRPPIFVDGKELTWHSTPQASQIDRGEWENRDKQIDKEIKVTVTARSGEQYTGSILFADSSTLLIWRSREPYRGDKLNEWAIQLSPLEIKRIVVEKEGHFFSGMGTGLLVGGGIGALLGFASGDDEPGILRFSAGTKALLLGIGLGVPSAIIGGITGAAQGIDEDFILNGDNEKYMKVLPKLRENAMFPSLPPSEIQNSLLQRNVESSSRIREPITRQVVDSPEDSKPKLHLSLSSATRLTGSAQRDMAGAFTSSGLGGTVSGWFGPSTYPYDASNPFSWNIALEYSITDQVHLGLERNSFPEPEIEGKDFQREYASGTSYTLFCSYVPYPIDPLFASGFEFALSAGMSYNSVSVGWSSLFSAAYAQNSNSVSINKRLWGLHLGAGYDYYFSRYFSLQGKIEGKLLPSMHIPTVIYIVNPYSNEAKILNPHSVNFSGIDFSFGVRCHL